MYDDSMKIAELLKSWRHRNEMTIEEAAKHLELATDTYRRIEKGSAMQGETLAVILKWLLS